VELESDAPPPPAARVLAHCRCDNRPCPAAAARVYLFHGAGGPWARAPLQQRVAAAL